MDFAYDDQTEQLRAQLQAFMDEHVFPAEKVFAAQLAEAEADGRIWERPAVRVLSATRQLRVYRGSRGTRRLRALRAPCSHQQQQNG